MLINGVTEYDKMGREVKTCLIIARATRDGQQFEGKSGPVGKVTVIPYTRQDGSALFLDLTGFGGIARCVAAVSKGDRVIAAGRIQEREYNGKQYVSLLLDFFENLTAEEKKPRKRKRDQDQALNELEDTINGFAEIDPADGELPF